MYIAERTTMIIILPTKTSILEPMTCFSMIVEKIRPLNLGNFFDGQKLTRYNYGDLQKLQQQARTYS